MNNNTIRLKIMQRLNKLSSRDYDNIECWQMVEAFNKAQLTWCRRQLHGMNKKQEGDEESKRRIDDLQVLLKDLPVTRFVTKDRYVEIESLPNDYFEYKRVSVKASVPECSNKRNMVVYLGEEGNLEILLKDENKKPNFPWGETFATLKGNKVLIYTNNEFTVNEGVLVYYQLPRNIEITGCMNLTTGAIPTVDVESMFKDDIVELIIDEAAKIIAGDIESFNQQQIADNEVESNN